MPLLLLLLRSATAAMLLVPVLLPASAGVVAQPGFGSTPTVKLTRVVQLGNDFDNEDFTFGKIVDIAPGSDGRMYALDALELGVKVFSKDGRFLRSIGRNGQGPGEFTHPILLNVDDERIMVADAMQRKTVTFTVDGRHVETRRQPQLDAGGSMYGVIRLRGGTSLGVTLPRFSSNPRATDPFTTLVILRSDGDGDTIARIRSDNANYVVTDPGYAFGGASSGFGKGGAWSMSGDSALVVVDGYTGLLKWFGADSRGVRLRREITIPGEAKPVSNAEMDRLRRRVLVDRNQLFSKRPAKRIEISEAPTKWSIVSDAILADDGSVWVSGPIQQGAPMRDWMIISANGESQGRGQLPAQFTPKAIEHRWYTALVFRSTTLRSWRYIGSSCRPDVDLRRKQRGQSATRCPIRSEADVSRIRSQAVRRQSALASREVWTA